MNLNEYKEKLFKDLEVKAEYDRLEPEYAFIRASLDARLKAQLTQQELSHKIGINRSEMGKIENAKLSFFP